MTQDVADTKINLGHVRQVHDLMGRVLKGSVSEEQMQAIALAVSAGQNASATALARMIKVAYARDPLQTRQFLTDQIGLYAKARVSAFEYVTGTAEVVSVLTQEGALKALDRVEYVDRDVLNNMPRGMVGRVELFFVKIGKNIPPAKLAEMLRVQGYALADPFTVMTWNAANREFADTHPNATEWLDADGNYCYAAFGRWGGARHVNVNRNDAGWNDLWWFVCERVGTSD